jgi:hypothetical protein
VIGGSIDHSSHSTQQLVGNIFDRLFFLAYTLYGSNLHQNGVLHPLVLQGVSIRLRVIWVVQKRHRSFGWLGLPSS